MAIFCGPVKTLRAGRAKLENHYSGGLTAAAVTPAFLRAQERAAVAGFVSSSIVRFGALLFDRAHQFFA
jgi:hypothetical protein